MKWMRNRFLLLPYVVLLTVLAVVGCTSKQDPSEVLPVCGNHSCGELVMVTTDTSSDGFHYLNPKLSPDGTRILFTAGWYAIPSDPRYEGDDLFTQNRQMILFPNQVGVQPALDLASQGGELISLRERSVPFADGDPFLEGILDDDKATPIWENDDSIIFSLRPTNVDRYRICRADISDPTLAPVEFLYMETRDNQPSPPFTQHLEPVLSPDVDQRWLAFTRSSCVIPDSFETCSGTSLWVLDMNTAGINDGYGASAYQLTAEYSRIETPNWSPDGARIVFSGGMDVAGAGTGAGTELFSVDFDAAAVEAGAVVMDNGLKRLTFTAQAEGDPIAGVLNNSPVFSNDGETIYFVSTRRAPAITLHDRSIWRIPEDGSLDPVIHYFTRQDEFDPTVLPDGRILLSSALGFPTEMLNRLEEEAYQRVSNDPEYAGLDEVQLRGLAADERLQLEFFAGVMTHIYIYRP